MHTDLDFEWRLNSVSERLAGAIDNANIIETVLSESFPSDADVDEITLDTLKNLAALRSVIDHLYLLHHDLEFIIQTFRKERIRKDPAGKEVQPEH